MKDAHFVSCRPWIKTPPLANRIGETNPDPAHLAHWPTRGPWGSAVWHCGIRMSGWNSWRATLAFSSALLSLYPLLVLGQNAFPCAVFRRSLAKPLQRTHMVTNRAKDQQNKLRNPTHIMTSSSLKSTVTGDIHYWWAGKAVTPGPCDDSATLHCIACYITEDRPVFTVKQSISLSRKQNSVGSEVGSNWK